MKLTTRIKLLSSPQQHQAPLRTMRQFNAACNHLSQFVFSRRVFDKYDLHQALYYTLRAQFGLSSQMAVRVLGKVADAYKTELTNARREERELSLCRFRDDSAVVYDARLLTYAKERVSIKTVCGRLTIPAVYRPGEALPRFQGEADLVLQNGCFYLLQTLVVEEAEPVAVSDCLGVDLGIVELAYDSDANAYTNPGIEQRRQKFERHRTALKTKKTKNARRRLKKIGKREKRFRKDINHTISKRIVALCSRTCRGLALEALEDFFDRTRVRKERRQERRTWAFGQLCFFLAYKATLAGLPVLLVDPRNTSRTCSGCQHCESANRRSQSEFVCQACGYAANADYNAACAIRLRAAINLPIAASSV
jgi:IS605 OrfB family transposase